MLEMGVGFDALFPKGFLCHREIVTQRDGHKAVDTAFQDLFDAGSCAQYRICRLGAPLPLRDSLRHALFFSVVHGTDAFDHPSGGYGFDSGCGLSPFLQRLDDTRINAWGV